MTAHEFYIKIKSLELQELKELAVIENKDDLIKLNQLQLHFGRTDKDQNIEPKYSDLYLKRKMRMPSYIAEIGVPDLYVTGAFYGGMDIIVENGEYFIISWDDKSRFLTERYVDILGLNDESIQKGQVIVTKTFVNLISEKLNN
jgi:hypothetical protein